MIEIINELSEIMDRKNELEIQVDNLNYVFQKTRLKAQQCLVEGNEEGYVNQIKIMDLLNIQLEGIAAESMELVNRSKKVMEKLGM